MSSFMEDWEKVIKTQGVKPTRVLIRERVEKAKARAKMMADGKRLYEAIGVQTGRAEYHTFPDRHAVVRVVLPDGKSCQHLIDEPGDEIGEFLAWVFNHFNDLTED